MNPISLRLDPDLREALQMLANADERSLSSYVTLVLRGHVTKTLAKEEKVQR